MNPKYRHVLLELMVEQMYLTVPINLAVSLLVSLVIAPTFGVLPVSIWFLVGVFIGVGRVLLFKQIIPPSLAAKQYKKITNIIGVMLFVGGLHWGAAGWFFLDSQNSNIYLFMAVAILGMVSASLANLSALPRLWLMYAVTIFAFVIARMISLNNWPVVVMSCLFIFGLWALSKKLGEQILASITKDFKNAELLQEVEIAKAKVEKTSIEKSRFMAAISHDLRQPLHAQGLFLYAMEEKLDKDEHKEILNKIILSNNELNSLFDSLLEISQLDAQTVKVNKSHQSLFSLCKNLITEYEQEAREKSISLDISGCDYTVFSDPVLLKRIIRNLLSNALKHTEQGSVKLNIEQAGDNVILSVIDTGIGIPQSEHQAIFDEYVQLNNKARDRSKGVGLGLALAKRICNLLGHTIEVQSSLGNGACFKLTVALGDANKIITQTQPIKTTKIEGLTIFVIDDEIEILESMKLLESSWSCQFELFSSMQELQTALMSSRKCVHTFNVNYPHC